MAPQQVLYTHSQSGRRPFTVFAALFCAGMVGFGLWKDAPWYAMLPMWSGLIGVGWLLFANPQSGILLTNDALHFHHRKLDRAVKLADIKRVERHIWSEGPDEITLILNYGEKLPIPPQCIDRGFVAALGEAGVPVVSA